MSRITLGEVSAGVHFRSKFQVRDMPVDEKVGMVSYARGPNRPLLEVTIGELLHRTADRFGERLAVASCHQRCV